VGEGPAGVPDRADVDEASLQLLGLGEAAGGGQQQDQQDGENDPPEFR
jgi:hypothetical protein